MKSLLKTSLLALVTAISLSGCHLKKDISESSNVKMREAESSSVTSTTITEECDSLVHPDSVELKAQGALSTLTSGGVIGVSTDTGTMTVKYDPGTGKIVAETKVRPAYIPVKKKKTTVIDQIQATASRSTESTYSKEKKVEKSGSIWYWPAVVCIAIILIIAILARAFYKKYIKTV